MRPPLPDSKKSRIFVRGCPRFLIKYDWLLEYLRERERERERESSKNIRMAKEIGHYFRCVKLFYVALSVGHDLLFDLAVR